MKSITLKGETADPKQLRSALGRFATGVTIVTTQTPGGRLEGLTVNSFSALSLDPPLILWSIRQSAYSLPSFLAAKGFAINVLSARQHALCQHFATPCADKFEAISFAPGMAGYPVFPESLAVFECETESTVEGGDHLIFIGRVVGAAYRDGDPLVFSSGEYCVPVKHRMPVEELQRVLA